MQIEQALKALGDPRLIRGTANRALDKSAEIIAERARELAPVDSGDLRKSIKVGSRSLSKGNRKFKKTDYGGDIVERYVGIDNRVRPAMPPKTGRRRKRKSGGSSGGAVSVYAQVVEYGLAGNPAQPFMRPAWEEKKKEAFGSVGKNMIAEIEKTAKRQAARAARLAAKASV